MVIQQRRAYSTSASRPYHSRQIRQSCRQLLGYGRAFGFIKIIFVYSAVFPWYNSMSWQNLLLAARFHFILNHISGFRCNSIVKCTNNLLVFGSRPIVSVYFQLEAIEVRMFKSLGRSDSFLGIKNHHFKHQVNCLVICIRDQLFQWSWYKFWESETDFSC